LDWQCSLCLIDWAKIVNNVAELVDAMKTFIAEQIKCDQALMVEMSKRQGPGDGNESSQKSSLPPVSKISDFKGYEAELSPRQWFAQARAKFPVAASAQDGGHLCAPCNGQLCKTCSYAMAGVFRDAGGNVLLSWERVDSFLGAHFGRLQARDVVLPELDALAVDPDNSSGFSA
jgi:hypothetical protein